MKKYCRNCYHPLPYKAKFCAHCGQKDTDGRIGMRSLMGRLWNNTVHLEGKFIRTAWQLFIPGKVTTEFFKGKQDRYPHPIRLFAIVMFLFLFLLNLMLKEQEATGDGKLFTYQENVPTQSGDSVVQERAFSDYERLKYKAILYDMRQDYENLPADWRNPHTQNSMDSLMKLFAERYGLETDGPLDSLFQDPLDSTGFGVGVGGVQIATLDLARYEPEEIIQRYQITDWLEKLIVRQGVKAYKAPEAFIHACIGSLTWAILLLVALMSGVLGLLYIRQDRYYVEHFIFLLHFHTGAMLLLLIALVGESVGLWGPDIIGVAAILPIPGLYFALRRYYKQGWFKTFAKWMLYSFSYLISFILLFVLGMVAVFALY